MIEQGRRKHIIDVCLKTFMAQGVSNTPTKDLCKALDMQTGGIFYYFSTKDEIVIECAEEAKERIERDLFEVALNDIYNPDKLIDDLYVRANEMRPLMNFFISVSTNKKYNEATKDILNRLNIRYDYYVQQLAEKLESKPDDVAPYIYTVINTMLSYMLFGEEKFVAPQLKLVKKALTNILNKNSLLMA